MTCSKGAVAPEIRASRRKGKTEERHARQASRRRAEPQVKRIAEGFSLSDRLGSGLFDVGRRECKQPFRLWQRQGVQHGRIHNRKNCCIRPMAKVSDKTAVTANAEFLNIILQP